MPDPDVEQLLAEGQRLLEAGDKVNAHAQFIKATEADPNNESAWLGRAHATENSDEALHALERALTINPNNPEAREEMTFLQVRRWRDATSAAVKPEEYKSRSFVRRNVGLLLVLLIVIILVASIGYLVFTNYPLPFLALGAAPTSVPTLEALQLPSTWTPTSTVAPTQTPAVTNTPSPTVTPSVVAGKIKDTANIRAGPGTFYLILGGLQKDNTITLVARSTDGRFYQFQNPDKNSLAWVFADLVQLTTGDASALPVATAPPYTPLPTRVAVVPTNTPSATPASSIEFTARVDHRAPNCGTWYLGGYIRDRFGRDLSGIRVRILDSAWHEIDTVMSGRVVDIPDPYRPGYWQKRFPSREEVQGKVVVVGADGSFKSEPIDFALTARCQSDNDVNEIQIDFTSTAF